MYTTQDFQIDCIVEAEFKITEEIRVEECHGYHTFDDGDIEVENMKVYIDVSGKQFDITDRLTKDELKTIMDSLQPEFD